MTASFCAAPHPDDPEVFCNRPGSGKFGNHQFHSGFSIRHDRYVDWDNKGFVPSEKQRKDEASDKNHSLMKDIASRIRRD
jgi:hypothetical protein